jgi:hypothetical protein
MLPAPKKKLPGKIQFIVTMTLTAKRRERERYRRGKEERAGLLPVVIYSVIIKYLLKANGQAEQLFNLSTLPRVAPPSRYETRFFSPSS